MEENRFRPVTIPFLLGSGPVSQNLNQANKVKFITEIEKEVEPSECIPFHTPTAERVTMPG